MHLLSFGDIRQIDSKFRANILNGIGHRECQRNLSCRNFGENWLNFQITHIQQLKREINNSYSYISSTPSHT